MWRALNVLLISTALGGAAYVYHLKHQAEVKAGEVHALERKIAQERQLAKEFHAEFSVLTQPGRIQSLTEKFQSYLELSSVEPQQIAAIDDIPMRPPEANQPEAEREAWIPNIIPQAKPTITGSIAAPSPSAATTTTASAARRIVPMPSGPLVTNSISGGQGAATAPKKVSERPASPLPRSLEPRADDPLLKLLR